jgi:Protein-L-isoaspartate carboxylmethyltransferase
MVIIDEITRQFIRSHYNEDVRSLALQSQRYKGVNMPVALTQIAGWRKAVEKIPSWSKIEDIAYPVHLSLEQCSSENTARFKAGIIESMISENGDESLTDLTGGFGIDCAFLAPLFQRVTYVERQQELCEIATYNFPLLGLDKIQVIHEDGCRYLREMPHVNWIFIDPARRDKQGGKVFAIADCEPNVVELESLLLEKAEHVMVKLSPMLDLSQAINELKGVEAAYVISVGNECKELLLILGHNPLPAEQVVVHCVNLSTKRTGIFEPPGYASLHCTNRTTKAKSIINRIPADDLSLATNTDKNFSFTREQESNAICEYTAKPDGYLYEPNASILKAGAFRSIAMAFQLKKLHSNSHLYVSDKLIDGFPGRRFHINGVSSPNKKELSELLGGIKKANLSIRNFPSTTAELGKKLNVKDGGDIYLFATTLADERKVIIHCEKC